MIVVQLAKCTASEVVVVSTTFRRPVDQCLGRHHYDVMGMRRAARQLDDSWKS